MGVEIRVLVKVWKSEVHLCELAGGACSIAYWISESWELKIRLRHSVVLFVVAGTSFILASQRFWYLFLLKTCLNFLQNMDMVYLFAIFSFQLGKEIVARGCEYN